MMPYRIKLISKAMVHSASNVLFSQWIQCWPAPSIQSLSIWLRWVTCFQPVQKEPKAILSPHKKPVNWVVMQGAWPQRASSPSNLSRQHKALYSNLAWKPSSQSSEFNPSITCIPLQKSCVTPNPLSYSIYFSSKMISLHSSQKAPSRITWSKKKKKNKMGRVLQCQVQPR